MLIVVGTMKVRKDARAYFLAAAQAMITASRLEAGCISYDYFESVMEEDVFHAHERWQSHEILQEHFRKPHTGAFMKALAASAATPPHAEIINPAEIGPLLGSKK